MSTNRKSARAALAAFLVTALTPDPVVNVYAYPASLKELNGIYPIVRLTSLSSERARKYLGNSFSAEFIIGLEIFVRQSDPDASFTEQNAEDKLDDIEQLIRDAFASPANVHAGGFDIAAYDRGSEVISIEMDDGIIYRREVIPVRLKMLNG